jgi:Flp pilus assembly secretin CpaC
MRRTLFAALIVVAASPAYAEGVVISMDEVRTITFLKPVSTVYVGNSSIAEVNMIDSRHAFVLGKVPGITNIVALDHQGDQVSNTHVNVMAREAATVMLQQGAARITYSCTASHCDQTPEPGDNKPDYDRVSSEIGTHEGTAKGAAAP